MADQWYIRRGDEQWGPLTPLEFEELRRQGHLRSTDWVWFSTWTEWRLARDLSDTPPPFPAAAIIEVELADGIQRLPLQKAMNALLSEHLEYLGIGAAGQQSQYVRIMRELLSSPIRSKGNAWTEQDLRALIYEADELVSNFSAACRTPDQNSIKALWTTNEVDGPTEAERTDERLRDIWKHKDLSRAFREGRTSSEACPMDREWLAGIAVEYLQQELRSPLFEVLLVDTLVAREVFLFGEEIKENPTKFSGQSTLNIFGTTWSDFETYDAAKGNLEALTWLRLKRNIKRRLTFIALLYGSPLTIAYIAQQNNSQLLAFSAIAFCAAILILRVVTSILRKIKTFIRPPEKTGPERALEIYRRMVLAYEELRGGIASSPRRIREALSNVADEGAGWDPEVYSILDAAIARSAGNWS